MAAQTTPFPFDDFKVKLGGTVLEGLKSADLVITQDLGETVAGVPNTWTDYCKGMRSWQINFSGGWNETNPECGAGASLKFDGTNAWKGFVSATVNMEATMIDISSSNSSSVREFIPGRRRVSIDFEGIYYDHGSTAANWATLYNNVAEGTTNCSIIVAFGTGSSFTFSGYAENLTISRQDDDVVKMSGSVAAYGTVTDGSAGATGIDKLFTAFWGESSISTEFSSASSANLEYTGTTYVASLSVAIPLSEQIEFSGTLQGSGTLTDAAGS